MDISSNGISTIPNCPVIFIEICNPDSAGERFTHKLKAENQHDLLVVRAPVESQ